jgi:hypothetical protein
MAEAKEALSPSENLESTLIDTSRMKEGAEDTPAPFIDLTLSRPRLQIRWANVISQDDWAVYRQAMETVRATGVKFMLGGGFALAAYTGRWRDTKDIDFYLHPETRQIAVDALTEAGFTDYYEEKPYERHWIYRSTRNRVIVDIIWGMANQRARVDPLWIERALPMTIRSQQVLVMPAEEFIWAKLYIIQRDHCDWTDVFNLLHAYGPQVDWDHLIWRLEEDVMLLKGMLTTYAWLCPHDVLKLPSALWRKLDLPEPESHGPPPKYNRIRLLDSREWFVGFLPEDKKLAV